MRLLTLALLLLLSTAAFGREGKWTPQQVLQLDAAWLKKEGLEIAPSRLWDEKRGTGLLAATISTGGCSGGFISSEGLFVTNHHCLFGMLQEHATPQNDIITNGFLARTREEELKSKTVRVTIPRRFVDVTSQVLAAVPASASDVDRHRAIQRKRNELVAECEKQPGMRCTVAAHDGGVQYVLQETAEIADVRLVWAPPRAIGEFGGEVDNWMWPRHTGDFAIGRVYVDGKPYKPEFWFPISTKGVKPNDFIMVLGYPGVTFRALTGNEMNERVLYFQRRGDLYAEWIRLLEGAAKGNAAGEIAVADTVKTLANRQKNALGQLAGLERGNILAKERTANETVLAWAKGQSQHRGAVAAYEELAKIAAEQTRTFERDFLLDQVRMTPASLAPVGPKSLVFGLAVARGSLERQKPDADRDGVFMQRNIGRVRDRLERDQKSYFAAADKAVLTSFVTRALALPADQRIAAIDAAFRNATNVAARVDELYAQSKLFDAAERLKMFDETPEQLRARRDPLVDLGFALNTEISEYAQRKDRWEGATARLRPEWRRAVIAHAGRPVAYDANSTLRVSFGHVQGYSPRDGLLATPQTTLSGIVQKHTNEEPFDVPDDVLAAARAKRHGRWSDPHLKDVPVNFLADADTTGGNSGSPTLNGRGELVGVNFDRVWENVANDFGFNPDVARNVNADVRYMLWVLEQVQGAKALLEELGVK